MTSTAFYIAPYALDNVLAIECGEGLSVIEMDNWWAELWMDYGVRLTAVNDSRFGAGRALLKRLPNNKIPAKKHNHS